MTINNNNNNSQTRGLYALPGACQAPPSHSDRIQERHGLVLRMNHMVYHHHHHHNIVSERSGSSTDDGKQRGVISSR